MAKLANSLTSAIVWDLKLAGAVSDPRAVRVLAERIRARGYVDFTPAAVSTCLQQLEKAGVVRRSTPAPKQPVNYIELLDAQDYPNPFGDQGYIDTDTERMGAEHPRRRRSSLESLLRQIERLPVAEQLMLIGAICDQLAGVIDEREERIRNALKAL